MGGQGGGHQLVVGVAGEEFLVVEEKGADGVKEKGCASEADSLMSGEAGGAEKERGAGGHGHQAGRWE